MKKVLFCIESLSGGGAEKVLSTIVKNINKEKFDLTVLLVTEVGVYLEEVKKYCKVRAMLPDYNSLKNPLEKIKYKMDYKFIYNSKPNKVYNKYVTEQYDIEVAFVEGFATRFIANSTNNKSTKYCWVHVDPIERDYADYYFNSLEEQVEVYKKFNKIICVSNSVKNSLSKKLNLKENLITIYNPLDKEEILSKIKDVNIHRTNKLKFITVGRLETQKGYDRLIDAFTQFPTNSYELEILGEGSQRSFLEEKINKYHLNDNIKLLGFKSNPYNYMHNADVFICSSRAEGYSLVIAEAMIIGLPIVTTECSGPNELVDNGKYGLLVENSINGLIYAIDLLMRDSSYLEKMKHLSAIRSEFFSKEETLNTIEKVLMGE